MEFLVNCALILATLGGGAALLVRFGGSGRSARGELRARARRQLEAGSAVVAEGEIVTLVGVARPVGDPLVAPLSGDRCVAHTSILTTVATPSGVDRHGRYELVLAIACRFELDLGSRKVTVDAGQVVLDLPLDPVIPQDRARCTQFTKRFDLHLISIETAHQALVVSGTRVAVSGVLVRERDLARAGEQGYRDEAVTERLVGTAEHPLTIGPPT